MSLWIGVLIGLGAGLLINLIVGFIKKRRFSKKRRMLIRDIDEIIRLGKNSKNEMSLL